MSNSNPYDLPSGTEVPAYGTLYVRNHPTISAHLQITSAEPSTLRSFLGLAQSVQIVGSSITILPLNDP